MPQYLLNEEMTSEDVVALPRADAARVGGARVGIGDAVVDLVADEAHPVGRGTSR